MIDEEARYYFNGCDRLVVWFGGINEPFFSEKFAEASGCDCVFVRDTRFDWYTAGVLPSHTSAIEGRDFLKEIIARGYRKVIFCGQSSGGYGALFYGWHCPANLVIAFAPQTRNVRNGQNMMVPQVPISDVGDLYLSGSHTRIILNLSRNENSHEDEFFWDDWRQIRKLSEYHAATVVSHPYDNHSVSVKLREDGLLYRYVSALIDVYTE
ncbi:hypothetical protein ACQKGL_03145 [Ensifer adhaerens]|uniref:hypothetical protein n=1 Tax=Ensifer adhaerens TaxID=106592 RepID=UPI003D094357